jgi:hypothetical protein
LVDASAPTCRGPTRRNNAIGRHLGVPTANIPTAQAAAHFGWLAPSMTIDNPTSSARTQQLLDWKPTQPGLIEDLDQGHYFTTA